MSDLFKDGLLFIPKPIHEYGCDICERNTVFKSKIIQYRDFINNIVPIMLVTCIVCNNYRYTFKKNEINYLTDFYYLKDHHCILSIKVTPTHLE